MPEFEETQPNTDPAQTYTPGEEAKPRTRRRSGGFKKEHTEAPKGNMGEIDPAEAFSTEALSGADKPDEVASMPTSSRKPDVAQEPSESPRPKLVEETPRTDPQPTDATLAAVKRVEERIVQRKAERDARKKNSPDRPAPKAGKKPPQKRKNNTPAKTGLIASILKLFGLGPKPAKRNARKGGSNQSGQRGRGPRNGGGANRRPQGGRGRRGGRGGNRRQPAQSRETQ